MSSYIGFEDLFAAGIGFDICGAMLLARGALLSPGELIAATGTYWGANWFARLQAVQNRVDGRFGLAGLAIGFGLQLAGYTFIAGLVSDARPSIGRAIVIVAVAMSGFGLLWSAHRLLRPRLIDAMIIEVAHIRDVRVGAWTKVDVPSATVLQGLGEMLGRARLESESTSDYMQRAWSISDFEDDIAEK